MWVSQFPWGFNLSLDFDYCWYSVLSRGGQIWCRVILIFLYLLRLIVCSCMRPTLKKVPRGAEKVYPFIFEWNVLKIYVRFILFLTAFSSKISLSNFSLNDLSNGKVGIAVSHYHYVSICDFSLSLVSIINSGA